MVGSVILIVVERPEQRAFFTSHLKNTAHRLVFALDGEDGLERFREAKPDLVLAHIHAPKIDGPILCQLLRKEPGERVPFVLFGEGLAADPSVAGEVGAEGVISLPIGRANLIASIGRFLLLRAPVMPHAHASHLSADRAPSERGAFDSKTNVEEDERNDDIPTNISKLPADLFAPPAPTAPAFTANPPRSASSEESTGPIPLPDSLSTAPIEIPENPWAISSVIDPAAEPADTPAGGSEGRRLHEMLEEPPLPIGALTPSRMISNGEGATSRVSADALIEELPRDRSSSAMASPEPEGGKGRLRKGLEESQLGRRLIKRVHRVHALLDQLDDHQVLGIERDASAAQLRAAYFELSLEFHPDRFFLLRSGSVKEKIYVIFRRITEAYNALEDQRRRAEHVRPSMAPPRTSEPRLDTATQTAAGKRFTQLAHSASKAGDLEGARLFLAFALAHEPQGGAIRRAYEEACAQRARAQRDVLASA